MKNILKNNVFVSQFTFICIILIVFGSFYYSKPPKVLPENAPLNVFSAERAMKYLPTIAAKPHSIGTAENLKVRDFIMNELKSLGTEPELQVTEVYNPNWHAAAMVGNIIVKLPGTDNSKAILILGHYDSAEYSYGASDDGSAIIVMLETLRMLHANTPLKNDVVFLFSDGEEAGMLGATAFIEQHPLAKNIGLVLNFESSGTSGQSMMFETSSDNNWIISEFAKAVPFPIANSVSYEIYRNMPNDTDLTPFKQKGFKGFNFAFIENRFDYHTSGDNIKNTSIESVQHHGSYAASLILHFGNIDLNNSKKGNAVYFNTIGYGFVHYSYKWITPFVTLTFFALLFVIIVGLVKRIIRPLRTLFGFLAFIIHIVIAPSIVTCLYYILVKYYPENEFRLLFYNQNTLLLGFAGISVAISFIYYKLIITGVKVYHVLVFLTGMLVLLIWSGQVSIITSLVAVALSVIIYFLFRRPTHVWELSIGSLVGWAIIMVIGSILMPGISYLFTWPLMCSLIPIGTYFMKKNQGEYSTLQIGLFLVFALPAVIWFSNLTYVFLIAMGLKMAGAAVLFTALCLSLLIPHIEIISRVRQWLIPIMAASFGLFFLLKGTVNHNYNERYRQQNSIIYAFNDETSETCWSSLEEKTDEWTMSFLSNKPDTCKMLAFFPLNETSFLKRTIKTDSLPLPDVKVLNNRIEGKFRLLQLHITSGRSANHLNIYLNTKSNDTKVGINKSELVALSKINKTSWHLIQYYAFPPEGIVLNLKFESDKKIEIRIIDVIIGLPDFLSYAIKQRPANMMPDGDRSMVANAFSFERYSMFQAKFYISKTFVNLDKSPRKLVLDYNLNVVQHVLPISK